MNSSVRTIYAGFLTGVSYARDNVKSLCLVTEILFAWTRVCHDIGIPFREVSPSWSKHKLWEEAFVTSKASLFHINELTIPGQHIIM